MILKVSCNHFFVTDHRAKVRRTSRDGHWLPTSDYWAFAFLYQFFMNLRRSLAIDKKKIGSNQEQTYETMPNYCLTFI